MLRSPLSCVLVAGLLAGASPAPDKLKSESLSGYAEWRWGSDGLVVDGERVRTDRLTQFKTKGMTSLAAVALGSEVSVTGTRQLDGSVLAKTVEAKPNGTAWFEKEVREATDDVEAKWLQSGEVYEPDKDGNRKIIGEVVEEGPYPDRAQRILDRLVPPYIDRRGLRLHVVDTKAWNAMAMGNGAIWVFTGLMRDMDDDEVAIVLGHELVHYTHEHTRKQYRRALITGLITAGALLVTEATVKNDKAKLAIGAAGVGVLLVTRSGYSRDLEDQADRVGLRYAYEGGFDAGKGPRLWGRFRDKYGDQNGLVNFFIGDHSQSSARIKNLDQEIAYNYSDAGRSPRAPR